MKTPRLIPVVIFAGVSLFGLKLAGMIDNGFRPDAGLAIAQTAREQDAGEQDGLRRDGEAGAAQNADEAEAGGNIAKRYPTDEVPPLPPGTPRPENRPYVTTGPASGEPADAELLTGLSEGERLLLQRLSERRKELDERESALSERAAMLEAAEKRIDARIKRLEELEASIAAKTAEREKRRQEEIAGLVEMYENMKPRDAAKVFDRLQLEVLVRVVEEMKPRVMSAILAEMKPQKAEELTMAIAERTNLQSRSGQESEKGENELAPIDG